MSTTKYIMFGKVTAVVKASPGTGIVSSFILESDDLDEIDWEWLGSTNINVESNFFGKGNTTSYDRALYHPVTTPIDVFNTYVIDWTSTAINWYINDLSTPVRTLKYTDSLSNFGSNYPQTPMMIKMGSWVGCPDATDPKITGTCEWAGGQAQFPATYNMYVKSVTIEDYGCGSEYTYGDLTGSYQSIVASGDCDGKSVGSSSGSSASKSSTASSAAASKSSTTNKGGVFAGSSTSSAASSSTGSSKTSGSSVASSSGSTTLTSATSTGTSVSKTSSVSSGTPSPTTGTNAGQSKYGAIDVGVMVLGLGVGYLVM
jgi:beta-glucanase (GH16 family)